MSHSLSAMRRVAIGRFAIPKGIRHSKIISFKLMILSLLYMSASAEGQSIRETAMSDPLAVVAVLKEAQKGKHALFESNHISLCDFVLSPDAYTIQAEREKGYMLMVFLNSVALTEAQLEHDLTSAGYPKDIWRNSLDQLTKAQVDLAVQETKRNKSLIDVMNSAPKILKSKETALFAILEAFRHQSKKKLPIFEIDSDYCGGDYIGMVNSATWRSCEAYY
jgi:hypothetical protein